MNQELRVGEIMIVNNHMQIPAQILAYACSGNKTYYLCPLFSGFWLCFPVVFIPAEGNK